jgi:hypothetical protein
MLKYKQIACHVDCNWDFNGYAGKVPSAKLKESLFEGDFSLNVKTNGRKVGILYTCPY